MARVPELSCPELSPRRLALKLLLPVRLGKQEPPPWGQGVCSRAEDSFRRCAVVEGVIEKASIEAPSEPHVLHVSDLKPDLEVLESSLLPRDLDHCWRDVIPLRLDS